MKRRFLLLFLLLVLSGCAAMNMGRSMRLLKIEQGTGVKMVGPVRLHHGENGIGFAAKGYDCVSRRGGELTVRALDAARNVAIFETTFSWSDLVFPRHSVERKRHDCRLVGHIRGLELSPGKNIPENVRDVYIVFDVRGFEYDGEMSLVAWNIGNGLIYDDVIVEND